MDTIDPRAKGRAQFWQRLLMMLLLLFKLFELLLLLLLLCLSSSSLLLFAVVAACLSFVSFKFIKLYLLRWRQLVNTFIRATGSIHFIIIFVALFVALFVAGAAAVVVVAAAFDCPKYINAAMRISKNFEQLLPATSSSIGIHAQFAAVVHCCRCGM